MKSEPEKAAMHGWGGLRTWLWIFALVAALLVTSAIIYEVVGNGVLTDWNLGEPPTAPGCLLAPGLNI